MTRSLRGPGAGLAAQELCWTASTARNWFSAPSSEPKRPSPAHQELCAAPPAIRSLIWRSSRLVQQKTGKELAPSQREALREALTGGTHHHGRTGVGKTTLVNAILLILRAKKMRCLLCAPTAGRRSGLPKQPAGAKTIHRLLEVQPGAARSRATSAGR